MSLQLFEHAGWDKAHDPHMWWIYDSRETSPRTCPVCLGLHGTVYRGDEVLQAFPYHVHMQVNAIKARVHPNCRCVLRWAGRSKDVLSSPLGLVKHHEKPQLPRKLREPKKLSPSQHLLWWQISKVSRGGKYSR